MSILLFFPVLLLILLGLLAEVFLGVWTYRDARARGLNAALWTVVVLLVPSFIGLIVYLVAGRNQATGLCPGCSAAIQPNVKFCPRCGAAVGGGEGPAPKPIPRTGRGLLIAFIVCFAVMVLGVGAYAVFGLVLFNAQAHSGIERNISIGSIENQSQKDWHMSFMSLEGEKKNSQLRYDGTSPSAVHVKSSLGSGKLTLELTQGSVRQALDLSAPQMVGDIDLSMFAPGTIEMRVIAEEAKDGNVDISWD